MQPYYATYKDYDAVIHAENEEEARKIAEKHTKDYGKVLSLELGKYELYVLDHRTGEEEHIGYWKERDTDYKGRVFQLQISRGNHEEIRWRVVPNSKE